MNHTLVIQPPVGRVDAVTSRRLLALLIGAFAALFVATAAPATADDEMPPCSLGPLCNIMPIAPDLDHDLDLTKDQPPILAPDTAAPVNPCSIRCI
jgi:hypothetical protein